MRPTFWALHVLSISDETVEKSLHPGISNAHNVTGWAQTLKASPKVSDDTWSCLVEEKAQCVIQGASELASHLQKR